jgi:predicted PurR-regulated permease PerM
MSFIESLQKPKLVESKTIEKITKVQQILKEQNISFIQQLANSLLNFIIKNIGSIIVIILLIILLYYRYNEVQEKKNIKKLKYL